MRMKIIDMIFVENAKRVVNISQPKRRWGAKCNSSVFNVFHVRRSSNRSSAITHRSAKDLFGKRVFIKKYSRKTIFKTYCYSKEVKKLHEDKDSSEEV